MWTGKRSVVYVKSETGQGVNFRMREVNLGPALGESYIIESGLQEGEEIAVNGTFSIDAAAQLAGKPSMMNPGGGKVSTTQIHGDMEMGEETMPQTPAKVEPVRANPKFTAQLALVYENYLNMKNAFVATDAQKVSNEAKNVAKSLQDVNMKLLNGDSHMAWMNQLKTFKHEINVISNSQDISEQRAAFVKFNEAFYQSVKMFGLTNDTAYYQFCPMANNDKGAYWLSETKEIRNPYFGDEMLECGETMETLK